MTIGGINMGNLPKYLLVFTDGSTDANWQGATKGYIGDVAVDGIEASERTSGSVPYAGTIYTNAATLSAWQNIVNQNVGQASGSVNQSTIINGLQADLISAIQQINTLPATPGYENRSLASLDGLNTENGINEVFVINITSGLNFSNKINITGDAGDVYILRWDEDGNPSNGYQGQVKPQSGGAIVPAGGLKATNFINVAGDINSSGGGTNPSLPYPQGPRYNDGTGSLIIGGQDFNGGGFFTGYWLTTGKPTDLDVVTGLYYGETSSLSNGIFVGGWYTITTKFSMTSGTSGVYVSPNPATLNEPSINIEKLISTDGGMTFIHANTAPGPNIVSSINPIYKITVTNNGNAELTDVVISDNVLGPIANLPNFAIGETYQTIINGTWALGQHNNIATATGNFGEQVVTDSDSAYYVGVLAGIKLIKEISIDGGITWLHANTSPGPFIGSSVTPKFRFTVTNIGSNTLTDVTVMDDVFGLVISTPTLDPSDSLIYVTSQAWAAGQHVNIGTATGTFDNVAYKDSDRAYYYGVSGPAIDIQKFVSVDNGNTWIDANTPPGPKLADGNTPKFRYVITNTGDSSLIDIIITDDIYGPIGTIPELQPGDSQEFII